MVREKEGECVGGILVKEKDEDVNGKRRKKGKVQVVYEVGEDENVDCKIKKKGKVQVVYCQRKRSRCKY